MFIWKYILSSFAFKSALVSGIASLYVGFSAGAVVTISVKPLTVTVTLTFADSFPSLYVATETVCVPATIFLNLYEPHPTFFATLVSSTYTLYELIVPYPHTTVIWLFTGDEATKPNGAGRLESTPIASVVCGTFVVSGAFVVCGTFVVSGAFVVGATADCATFTVIVVCADSFPFFVVVIATVWLPAAYPSYT